MTQPITTNNTSENQINHSKNKSTDPLLHELAKGIQSMRNGEVYTIDEAWEEIDQVSKSD